MLQLTSHFQTTLAHSVQCAGVGLHTGRMVHMTLLPAQANAGITFLREDVGGRDAEVPARWDLVSETTLGTTITNKHGVSVATIEHLMAALWGCGVDNAIVMLDGLEVPIMDGSSEPFVALIDQAGITALKTPRKMIEILKPVQIVDGKSRVMLSPYDGFTVNMEIDFPGTIVDRQSLAYDFDAITFKDMLGRARTFCFEYEVEKMHQMGLARGGSLANAIVVGKEAILNKEGLRYTDEFVRHKALDCVGDMFLSGHYIKGAIMAYRPGHKVNNLLLRQLFADKHNWRLATQKKEKHKSMQPAIMPAGETAVAYI